MAETGNLYVISAPSGTGKTTLVRALVSSMTNITVSISHTTRAKRESEQDGVNYYFINDKEFRKMIDEEAFLEHAVIFKHSYGTSRSWVENTLLKGIDVILEIDWQGHQQIKRIFPECITIFILPPSLKALATRLIHRNQDNKDVIQQRLADVREATQHIAEYQFIIVNDDFDIALSDLKAIIQTGRLQKNRQITKLAGLLNDLTSSAD